MFWRIDSDKNGPYISFRICEWYYSKEKETRHRQLYQKLSSLMAEIVGDIHDKLDLRKAEKVIREGIMKQHFFITI